MLLNILELLKMKITELVNYRNKLYSIDAPDRDGTVTYEESHIWLAWLVGCSWVRCGELCSEIF
jgi:hypothetical protein